MAVKDSKIDPLVKAKNCMAKFNLSYEFVYDAYNNLSNKTINEDYMNDLVNNLK